MKLKTKLLGILVPLILIPILGIGITAYEYLQYTALQSARAQLHGLTKQLDITVRTHIKNTENSLSLLSKNRLIQEYVTSNEDTRYYLLQKPLTRFLKEHQATYPNQHEIRIILPDDLENLRVSNQPKRNNTHGESKRELYKLLNPESQDIQHLLYLNKGNQSPSLLFSKALILNNKTADAHGTEASLRGFLTITLKPNFITQLLTALPSSLPVDLVVTDRFNTVYLTTNAELPTKAITTPELYESIKNTSVSQITVKNNQYLIATHDISNNIRIFSIVNTDTLFHDADNLSRTVIILSILVVLISSIILYIVITKTIIAPLNTLNKAANHISLGKIENIPPNTKKDEIGDLFRSFTEMSHNLKTSTEQIEELAYFDNLTGLPNKVTFFETIGRLIERSENKQTKLAVIFFDLDNFKNINDGLGHQMGDLLLMHVGSRIKDCLRDSDVISNLSEVYSLQGSHLISRMGGDEFALILSDLTHKSEAKKIAIRILTELARPFVLDNHEIYIGASIGLALYPENGNNPEALLKHADIAMYEAKFKGKNNFQFFEESMTDVLNKRLSLEAAIRIAIEKNEFRLHYQPKVSLKDNSRLEFEALIRWHTSNQGFISPADFIPIAEESGLILQIGDWVLNEACRQTKQWIDEGHTDICISVNFSPVQINYGNPIQSVKSALQKHQLDPRHIELEITESGLMQNERVAIAYLNSLKELGVRIALDDFGTGYSSLAYLQRFPIDTLKIDRAFIIDVEHNTDSQHVLDTILFLAEKLNLETVAEGVETENQLTLIKSRGCEIVQGYYFSKPLPASEAITFFTQKKGSHKLPFSANL